MLKGMASKERDPVARLAYFILKKVNKLVRDEMLIADGDRIVVAVSGGKDSLALLRLLQWRQRAQPEHYDLLAAHVVVPGAVADEGRQQDLAALVASWGLPFRLLSVEVAPAESLPLPCYRCTQYRRAALGRFSLANGYNKVAFGHHFDDLVETALLNLFHSGQLTTLLPKRDYFDGALTLIRPLASVPESELRRLARLAAFPDLGYDCPLAGETQRAQVRELLRIMQRVNPAVKQNILRAAEACGEEAIKGVKDAELPF